MEINQVYAIDAAEGFDQMEDNSADLMLTDSPYGGGFMGLKWDMEIPRQEIWDGSFRVLKPGSFAFINCSPRFDCSIEIGLSLIRAGFNINFTPIPWAYSSGIPKAENISKAIDKRLGFERIDKPISKEATLLEGSFSGYQPKPSYENVIVVMKPLENLFRSNFWGKFKYDYFYTSSRKLTKLQAEKISDKYNIEAKEGDLFEKRIAINPELKDELLLNKKIIDSKPYRDTKLTSFLSQAMYSSKGITWLDDGRIPPSKNGDKWYKSCYPHKTNEYESTSYKIAYQRETMSDLRGRFPANLLVSDDVLNDGQKWNRGGSVECGGIKQNKIYGKDENERSDFKAYNDGESFSRYFDLDRWWEEKIKELPREVQRVFPFLLISKPSQTERNFGVENLEKEIGHNRFDTCEKCGGYIFQNKSRSSACKCEVPIRKHNVMKGNYHPTVKPIALGSYLVTIGSRIGDLVIDPFCGSGAYLISCKIWRRNYIGFDIREDYVEELAKPKLSAIPNQLLMDEYI